MSFLEYAMVRTGLQKSFVIHAVVFAVVVGGLALLDQRLSPGLDWSVIVAWGWGVGLAAHAAVTLLFGRGARRGA